MQKKHNVQKLRAKCHF